MFEVGERIGVVSVENDMFLTPKAWHASKLVMG